MSKPTLLKIDPSMLVSIENEQVFTTSLQVAEAFEKRHTDVLRDIKALDCSDDFRQRNFASAEYLDKQGKPRKAYRMTKDGFTFLAMGYTGKKAAQFKEAYIRAFNEMEAKLRGDALPNHENVREQLNKAVKTLVSVLNKNGHSLSYSDAWRLVHLKSGMDSVETASAPQLQAALNYASDLLEQALLKQQTKPVETQDEELVKLLNFTANRINLIAEYEKQLDKHWETLQTLKNQLTEARYRTFDLSIHLKMRADGIQKRLEVI